MPALPMKSIDHNNVCSFGKLMQDQLQEQNMLISKIKYKVIILMYFQCDISKVLSG